MILTILTILTFYAFGIVNAGQCTWNCSSSCFSCSKYLNHGTQYVNVDLSDCKSGSVSWACCTGSNTQPNNLNIGCTYIGCDGSYDSGTKCDGVTHATYLVPSDANYITVQVHDGILAGNVDCRNNGGCCGGFSSSCRTISGVCNYHINLTTCAIAECQFDNDCEQIPRGPCAKYQCQYGHCVALLKSNTTICRQAIGVCDQVEYCDGFHSSCPLDRTLPMKTLCREAVGSCDQNEYCNGITPLCPLDQVFSSKTVCRNSSGICDQIEYCDGITPICPSDQVFSSETVCRVSNGLCDFTESCDGIHPTCPTDNVLPSGTICRASKGVCDQTESCDGINPDCPLDYVLSSGTPCFGETDLCDLGARCNGINISCPINLQNGIGKTYKCGTTCFICALENSDLIQRKSGITVVDTCVIGQCDNYIYLPWPECVTQCVNTTCPNNKGLSNVEHYLCNPRTGSWICYDKREQPNSSVCLDTVGLTMTTAETIWRAWGINMTGNGSSFGISLTPSIVMMIVTIIFKESL